ncbi:MAG: electron transfer flavoprotein subunit alpha/FixB family protein [Nitrososphaeria archaeon]|nr:electron transfer flavoprotein subunit alpha/FixB family protein [Nitrososphaeria archaeon]
MEHIDGKLIPASLEMLGEARRLFDDYNKRYNLNEKVVAVLLGHNIKDLSKTLIEHGADAVVVADHPNLKDLINVIQTKVVNQITLSKEVAEKVEPSYASEYLRPRYMFFAADSIGRHLSSTVLADLDSGLASDVNKLVISDMSITHHIKTGGKPLMYDKTLEMYRVDFSGFLWTTILCLDNRNEKISVREYSPQACNIIPGAFQPIDPDPSRKGIIIDFEPKFDEADLKIKVLSQTFVKSEVDFENYKTIVGFVVEEFANLIGAQVGITLPISKNVFSANPATTSKYMIPARVIGTSGSKVGPMLYFAIGLSGAQQHLAGMEESGFVIAINTDEESPIKDASDIFLKGRLEDVLPLLMAEIKKEPQLVKAK